MRRLVLVDTGPVYAAVDPDDQLHARAQHELKRLARDRRQVVLVYPTLLEAYTLVLYRLGNRSASQWLQEITAGAALINPDPVDYRAAWRRVLELADQPVTLFDATVAVMATRLRAEIWTYDHHFDILRAPVWRPEA